MPAGVVFLSVDVESDPGRADRIFRIGAVRSDREAALDVAVARSSRETVVRRLNEFAAGADIVAGHNLRRHDLPALVGQFSGLALRELPVVDTLELSPLAFPRNPYHRLIKGYKIVSECRNDPVNDARLALALLADELREFGRLQLADPGWLDVLHCLLRDDPALDRLLRQIRGAPSPSPGDAGLHVREDFAGLCCATRLERLASENFAGAGAG
ncbi:MAG: RecQ family ATP-dependent DNA helicase, partial [Burkholderiaceae bacterium]